MNQVAETMQQDEKFLRQLDIFDPAKHQIPVSIIGAGGIGGIVALALGKMGLEQLDVYDFDEVTEWNVPNQMFRPDQIGLKKVEALLEVVDSLTGVEIEAIDQKIGENGNGIRRGGIVVSAVDNMETRKLIWESVKLNPKYQLFLDGRLGGEEIHLYTVNPCDPDHIKGYEATLFTDEEAEEVSCTAKSIIWTTFFIGGLVARSVAKYLKDGSITREVGFDSNFLTLYSSVMEK